MVTPEHLRTLITEYRLSQRTIAENLRRAEPVIEEWLKGSAPIPPYIELTLLAIKHGLVNSIPDIEELNAVTENIWGVEPEIWNFWKKTGQWPIAARLALRGYQWHRTYGNRKPLTSYDKAVLRNIYACKYFRVRGGYRARPVLGKHYPTIRLASVDKLSQAGLLKKDGESLKLTDQGKDVILI